MENSNKCYSAMIDYYFLENLRVAIYLEMTTDNDLSTFGVTMKH